MDFWGIIERPLAWVEAHPAVVAWIVGWWAAISAGQFFKRLAPVHFDQRHVERASQVIAVVTGSLVAWMLWPKLSDSRMTFAFVVGMSAPLAYDWGKAIIAWKWPSVARRVSVSGIRERKSGGPQAD